ncbi:MAG: ABC transporter permease [Terriglobia bacterium]
MTTLLQDVKCGLRMLARSPGFTAVAVLTLALGIGANTAIFSVVSTVFLRPLPYPDADRLVVINEGSKPMPEGPISYPNFLDWQTQSQVFDRMAAFQGEALTLVGVRVPESMPSLNASADFFPTLGVNPIYGRNFLPSEDKVGAPPVVIISNGLWQRRFGADPGLIGRSMRLKGTLGIRDFTVVGILPRDFEFYVPAELYVPIGLWGADGYLMKRENHDRTLAVARMKPGVSLEQARSQLETIAGRLQQQYPKTNTGFSVTVTPLRERVVGHVRRAVFVLLGAVGFVLLIACVNVANLLLARSVLRRKEVAIRIALGAGWGRVIRQLLTETALLGLAGGAVGLLLASWSSSAVARLVPPGLPVGGIAVDYRVLGFTLLLSLLTGLAFGLAPALHASELDLRGALKEGGRSSTESFRHRRLRSLLVVFEVALALVLLISAGLMIQSFRLLLKVDPGFNVQGVLTMGLDMSDPKYQENPARFMAFNAQLLERVRAIPGVQYAGTVRPLPLGGGRSALPFYREDRPIPSGGDFPAADWHAASPGYFQAMGIRLIRGRVFADSDRENTPRVAVISEGLARRYWPDEEPIGRRLRIGTPEMGLPWFTVVGVVGDTKPYGLEVSTPAELYVSCLQLGSWVDMSLVVRTASNPLGVAAAVRDQVLTLDKDMVVGDLQTMEQRLGGSLAGRRTNMLLLGIFAGLALVLAAVGIYGVMSYSVAQRTQEIGLRVALGARPADVLRLVVRQGMTLVLAGVGVGLAGSIAFTRVLRSMLFEVTPTDLVTFAGVSLLLTAVALLASYLPARRATKVDPMVALRYE